MARRATNRVLVVDDDLSVIAAYRYVLETYAGTSLGPAPAKLTDFDDELFGKDSRKDLAAMRLSVDFVDQGADAVDAVRRSIEASRPYAMIFLDLRMPPGLDGYETAEKIRKLDPIVKIVFVTAFCDYTAGELMSVAGPENRVQIMHKPVWPRDLCSVVDLELSGIETQ